MYCFYSVTVNNIWIDMRSAISIYYEMWMSL